MADSTSRRRPAGSPAPVESAAPATEAVSTPADDSGKPAFSAIFDLGMPELKRAGGGSGRQPHFPFDSLAKVGAGFLVEESAVKKVRNIVAQTNKRHSKASPDGAQRTIKGKDGESKSIPVLVYSKRFVLAQLSTDQASKLGEADKAKFGSLPFAVFRTA